MTQSSDTKGKHPEQDWDILLSGAKDNGWTKEKEEMATAWKDKKERS